MKIRCKKCNETIVVTDSRRCPACDTPYLLPPPTTPTAKAAKQAAHSIAAQAKAPSPSPRIIRRVFLPSCASGCLGGVLTLILALLALALGFCVLPFNTAFLGALLSLLAVFVTAIAVAPRRPRPPWPLFIAEVAAVGAIIIGFFVWDTPRYVYSCVLNSRPPWRITIMDAEYEEHPMDPSCWIHFKISPEALAADLAKAGFLYQPDANTTQPVINTQPGWWTPTALGPGARLLEKRDYREDLPDYVKSIRGLWVNAVSNEAYGYYLDF